jgi:hypothetical protein
MTMRKALGVALATVYCIAALAACSDTSGSGGGAATLGCGDGVCQDDACETCARCPQDCGACQEVICECGDDFCDNRYCAEDCSRCADDCGACFSCDDGGCEPEASCGDGVCHNGAQETWETCPEDCGGRFPGLYRCGDGNCDPGDEADCESACPRGGACNVACASDCDCEQPWTACGHGAEQNCVPLDCDSCFARQQSCNYNSNECSGASCQL